MPKKLRFKLGDRVTGVMRITIVVAITIALLVGALITWQGSRGWFALWMFCLGEQCGRGPEMLREWSRRKLLADIRKLQEEVRRA